MVQPDLSNITEQQTRQSINRLLSVTKVQSSRWHWHSLCHLLQRTSNSDSDCPANNYTHTHTCQIPQRIQYKLGVLVFNCVHGSAPGYLHEVIIPVANAEKTSSVLCLLGRLDHIPATRRSSLGDRAFAVAGPRVWNTLPDAIRRCSSPNSFKRSLKTHLYIQCYF